MRRIAWLAGLLPLGAAWACSSADNHPAALGGSSGMDSSVVVTGGDSGKLDSGVFDARSCLGAGDAAGCNMLEMCGPSLTLGSVTRSAPAALGGTIVDGIYDLTATLFYQTGANGMTATIRESIQITSNGTTSDGGADGGSEAQADDGGSEAGADDASMEAASEAGAGTPMLTIQEISDQGTGAGTYTWASQLLPASTITWTSVCPTGLSQSFSMTYTATPTTLLAYLATPDGTWEFTYTLR